MAQRIGRTVLGRHLQLPADMMLHKLAEKLLVLIPNQVIVPDAAADEYLFHLWQRPHPAQNVQILAVVDDQPAARLWCKAMLAACTHAVFHLLAAAWPAEICRRAAHIVNIALEAGLLC